MRTLTKAQKDILEYISAFSLKRGIAPSQREIGEYFGISSAGVHYHLKALEKKGKVALSEGKARALKIQDPAFTKHIDAYQIPFYPALPSRTDILEGRYEQSLKVSSLLIQDEDKYFAVAMDNSSMVNAGIKVGDILYFEKNSNAVGGDIVCVSVMEEEEVLIRRISILPGRFELIPECDNVGSIVCQECTVYGILKKAVRSYER